MPYVSHDDVHIYFELDGDGPPLVLQHGFSDSLVSWEEYGYRQALREHYLLILIDGRGHGASDKPTAPDAHSQAQRASDVIAVLDLLQIDRAHYFGYSLGGWIGFGLAKQAPKRIRSLILGGNHPFGQSMAFYRKALQDGIGSWTETLRNLADPLPLDIDRFVANDVASLRAAVAHDRPDISDLLPAMEMPCLLFAGDADPLHDDVKRSSETLPNADFFSVPGHNHIQTIIDSARVLPHVLSFLAQASTAANSQTIEQEDSYETGDYLYLWRG